MTQIEVLPGLDGHPGQQYSLGTDRAAIGDHSISYSLNRDRYRELEWDQCDFDGSAWLFGCSYAQGIGVAFEHTTAHVLSQLAGLPVINFAQGGSSIRYQCDQLALLLSQAVRPRKIAVIWPDMGRWPYYGAEDHTNPEYSNTMYQAHTQCDVYMRNRARLDVLGWRVMVAGLGIPSAELSWSEQTRRAVGRPESCLDPLQFYYPELDRARDGQHPGVTSHRVCAEEIHLQWQGLKD